MSIVPRASFSDDLRMVKKPLPKSLLLRDYLLDDMSSCSSNGFRSYPRRQCCTTIRFLVEMDLNKHNKLPSNQHRRAMIESKSNLKPKQPSMMQRASSMMINAFKHFPFPSTKSPRNKACFMPRSLSRKLLKHGLWKKTHNHNIEIKQLISLGDLMKKTDINCPTSPSKFSTAVSTSVIVELTCTNSNSNNNSNSNSWSSSDFTATTDNFATSNSSDANELLENKKGTNGKGVGTTTTTTTTTNDNNADASENAKKEWQNEQEEQSSPVCVMDFPSDNDNEEDEVSSLFQHNYLEVEGTKKLMHKTRRFEGVPQIEPVKLENRIAQLAQEEDIVRQKALALLQLMKSTFSSHHSLKCEAVESLLLAFFKERIRDNVHDYEMLQTAKDWMDGHLEEMSLDWESQNHRKPYVRDMENVVKWSKYDDKVEKDNIGLELECEIFNSLVNDILLEFHL